MVRRLAPEAVAERIPAGVAVAVVGRPNVGKSSLVNAVLGQARVLVHASPGTTRDAVDTPLTFRGRPYVLIDTAGIRRKGRVSEALEKLSVVMALKSLDRCQVAVLLLDASEGVSAQDAHIAGYVHEAGRGLVIAVNKWDLVPAGTVTKADVVGQIYDRIPFVDYAPVCFTSALHGSGLGELFEQIDRVAGEAQHRLDPAEILTVLRDAVERRPISSRGQPLRVRSAQQVGVSPPTFAVRVNFPDKVHFSYERYLLNSLRRAHPFTGSPIRLLFRRVAGPGKAGRAGPRSRR
jgi:GTP-binding protein